MTVSCVCVCVCAQICQRDSGKYNFGISCYMLELYQVRHVTGY